MSTLKQVVLRGIAKAAEKAAEGACGSKCAGYTYEPEMPKKLKEAKLAAKNIK